MSFYVVSIKALETEVSHMRYIIVDPGHGGQDNGVKITADLEEKNITLNIAQFLKKYLEYNGSIKVFLTRDSDRSVPFIERIKIAVADKADLFISIHVNAGFGKNASGFEIYLPVSKVSEIKRNDSNEIVQDMVRTRYFNESIRFAQLLDRQMEKIYPRKNRGLREFPIRIIQDLNMPAVAFETGFATNAQDKKELMNPSKQKLIAEAIGRSIEEYY
jgi:N-acetylmuramoyl-L-alanine amidase